MKKLLNLFKPSKNKRKRYLLPTEILIVSILLILLPFLDYFLICWQLKLRLTEINFFLKFYGKWNFLVMLMPIPIGIGLIAMRKEAWYALIAYGIFIIFFNLYYLIKIPVQYNIFSLLFSIAVFSFMVYYTRKDIAAPYIKDYKRGWRLAKRKPIRLKVIVNGKDKTTRDISPRGFFAETTNSNYKLNEEVKVHLNTKFGVERILRAGVVRIDTHGVGFAFRGEEIDLEEFV